MMELDEIDQIIIEFLLKDSQIAFSKIAKETGLSTDTVTRRYRRLEKEKVIQPVIQVDLTKLGYESMVFFGILVAAQNTRRAVTEAVAKIPDIVAVMETNGKFDLMVIGATRSITHSFSLGDKISKVKGVRRVCITDYGPMESQEHTVYPPPVWNNLDVEV